MTHFPRRQPEAPRSPETWDRYDDVLRRLRAVEDDIDEVAEHFNLTRGEAIALAIVYCTQALHLTEDPNTFVLVVRGNAAVYDNAVEAFLATADNGKYSELLAYLQTRKAHDGQKDASTDTEGDD